jgi:hypothetical protein
MLNIALSLAVSSMTVCSLRFEANSVFNSLCCHYVYTVSHFMEGKMAADVAKRRERNAGIHNSGWKTTDIMIPVTYYNDGVVPTDHGRIKIEVLLMNILSFSPEMQQKMWTNICLGYVNHSITGMTEEEVVGYVMR